jgi:hypothetical protein
VLHHYADVRKDLLILKEQYLWQVLLYKFLQVVIHTLDELVLNREPFLYKLFL